VVARRTLLAALCAGAGLGLAPAVGLGQRLGAGAAARTDRQAAFDAACARLERTYGGRLGVAMLDLGRDGAPLAHRGSERFALCSTFKLLAAGFVLARVDAGQERLQRRMPYARADLIVHSPVTAPHADDRAGMTLQALCEAAVTLSDNTAANLLLDSFGGPAALTGYLRTLGDTVTRLDRREPDLNRVEPGDPRDTTSPLAMLASLRRLVMGDALSVSSRARLAAWLRDCRTGTRQLRAGVPADWGAGDKTGAGRRQANDVAIFWPPGREPVLVAAYYESPEARIPEGRGDAVLSAVGRQVAAH